MSSAEMTVPAWTMERSRDTTLISGDGRYVVFEQFGARGDIKLSDGYPEGRRMRRLQLWHARRRDQGARGFPAVIVQRCTTMYYAGVSNTITVSKARAALPKILQRVLAGEEVTITRHGEPVAVVVRPDTLRARRARERLSDADRVRDLIASSRQAKLHPRPTLSEQQADALLADVQAARSKR
jgi:prevent-host-death family protein